MDRGIVLTGRTDYRERPLSGVFRVDVINALGTPRRVAVAAGSGRPLMILPGLYASLNEGLFAVIAELAAQRGRSVVLVEDRLAAGTLALNHGEIPSLSRIGAEIAALARQLGVQPDALALSAGAAAALAAAPGTFARIATWSGVVDIWAVAENLARHPMPRWHYAAVHKRAFVGANLPVPPIATVPARLAAGAPCGVPPGPLLVIHAEDDPVVPAASIRALPVEDEQCVTILPAGAHLGFGTLVGPDIYLAPFEEDTG
jgi:pimeloyl-ACP methyl ester carboxylesterase